jgi:hypothetical protein
MLRGALISAGRDGFESLQRLTTGTVELQRELQYADEDLVGISETLSTIAPALNVGELKSDFDSTGLRVAALATQLLRLPSVQGGLEDGSRGMNTSSFAFADTAKSKFSVPMMSGKDASPQPKSKATPDEIHVTNNYTIQALDGASVRDILVREQKTIAGMTLDVIGRHRALRGGA